MAMLNFRSDPETDKALAVLTEDGRDRSEAIRQAIRWAARQRALADLRQESEAVRDDPEDQAEARRILAEMESLHAER